MSNKRLLYGAFWFCNVFFGVFALYIAIAVQFDVHQNSLEFNSVTTAFQQGYMLGLDLQKKEAVYFFKTYALKLAVFAFIFSAFGTWFGWLPGTGKPKIDTTE